MTVPNVKVRRARRRDMPDIIGLGAALARHVEDAPPDWTPATLEPLVFGQNRWCDMLVAVSGGRVVGIAVLVRSLQLHDGKRKLYLADLSVAPDTKGLGVGRALMAGVARYALDLGCQAVFWEVWVGNAEAYRFYDRLGATRDEGTATLMSLDHDGLVRLADPSQASRRATTVPPS